MKNYRAKIAKQTLKLLKIYEWESISIDIISKKLKFSKKKISRNIKIKNDLLKNINQHFDDLMFVEMKSVEKSTSRDMIFEIIMLRFDLLNRYRTPILKIFSFFKYNPNNFIILLPTFIDSIEMMAKSSNIETKGAIGSIKLKGLLVIYFSTFLTWVKDEDSSLDKTMTVLDNCIGKAENILKFFKR